MKTMKGDLLKLGQDGHFDVIVHGCNCHCVMGAGIAKGVKALFPDAFKADKATAKGDKTKLGTFSWASVSTPSGELVVVNAYTQYNYRGKGPLVDYDALRLAFGSVREKFTGKRIGYPMIGAGLAGGDWDTISTIIDEELDGEDHTLVEYAP